LITRAVDKEILDIAKIIIGNIIAASFISIFIFYLLAMKDINNNFTFFKLKCFF